MGRTEYNMAICESEMDTMPPNAETPAFSSTALKSPVSPATRVSVVIPLYNHERYIEAAIRSVLSQTVPPAEIIVIDDGSTDGSAEIVRRLCEAHPEIIFWSWPNQGAHHTMNAGILRATGDFVAILNSDDCYVQDRLETCLDAFQSDPSIDVVATGASFLDEQGDTVANPWYDDALAFYKREGDFALGLFHANFLVTTSNLFIRRSLFESVGYFSPLRYTHDLEFCLRLILGRKLIHFLDSPLVAYRLHGTNTISENKAREDVERAAVFAFFLYRQWQGNAGNGTWRSFLERYVEVLGAQGILEMVEEFLALIEGGIQKEKTATAGSLPTEFWGFLSRLGIDWVAPGSADPLLTRFIAARDEFLRKRREAEGDPKLISALKANNDWLLEQRDAWEDAAQAQEEQTKSLAQALEEMRTGYAWLREQRDAWEQSARAQEERVNSLAQSLEEQVNWWTRKLEELLADKDWLLGQRDAWERAAKNADEEVVRCHGALDGLRNNRLFRLLLRAKLLELKHAPPD